MSCAAYALAWGLGSNSGKAMRHWDVIANYESFELVKRSYFTRHGMTPNTRHAREIAAPFVQARAYFLAARDADPTVKPLLLYYGVVGLSRGLTLMLSRGRREATLTPSHGLGIHDWGAELSKDNPDFAALRVSVSGNGTFSELLDATGNRSLLRFNSSAINHTTVFEQLPQGSRLSLGEIVLRIPELQDHHLRWLDTTRCMSPQIEAPANEPNARVTFQKHGRPWVNADNAEAIFAGTAFNPEAETPERISFVGPNQLAALPILTDSPGRGAGDWRYVACSPLSRRAQAIPDWNFVCRLLCPGDDRQVLSYAMDCTASRTSK